MKYAFIFSKYKNTVLPHGKDEIKFRSMFIEFS